MISYPHQSVQYLPPIKPSAIALGTVFTHVSNLAVLAPVFGDTYHRAQKADSKSDFLHSREAASAATLYGTTLLGSGVQTYALAALLSHAGILSYKGAAYIGGLVFAVTSVPTLVTQVIQERRPWDAVAVRAATSAVDTIGLSLFLNWWGTSTSEIL